MRIAVNIGETLSQNSTVMDALSTKRVIAKLNYCCELLTSAVRLSKRMARVWCEYARQLNGGVCKFISNPEN
jgi:hypothetical protein